MLEPFWHLLYIAICILQYFKIYNLLCEIDVMSRNFFSDSIMSKYCELKSKKIKKYYIVIGLNWIWIQEKNLGLDWTGFGLKKTKFRSRLNGLKKKLFGPNFSSPKNFKLNLNLVKSNTVQFTPTNLCAYQKKKRMYCVGLVRHNILIGRGTRAALIKTEKI